MSGKAYNWHLKREMEYKYPESRPERQVAWVFDTNKCIACQTCTFACKNAWTAGKGQEHMFWNNVETKPWGSYPMGWDVRLLEKLGPQEWSADGTYLGKTIWESAPYGEEAAGFLPEEDDYLSPNLGEDEVSAPVRQGEYLKLPHQPWMYYLQRICNHCTYPACLQACTRKAIYKRSDGIVLIDQERCEGYQECVRACPYKKSFFRSYTGKSEKCISCFPAVEKGMQTQCVVNCIGKIRIMGFKARHDSFREDNPLDYLIHARRIALPSFPQFGTEPNVYYIPPVNVPAAFNRQVFGPGAERAVQLYRSASQDKDLKLIGLLMLFGATDHIIDTFAVEGDIDAGHCYGYDEKGEEVARVPLREPIIVRKRYDEQLDVHRVNIS